MMMLNILSIGSRGFIAIVGGVKDDSKVGLLKPASFLPGT